MGKKELTTAVLDLEYKTFIINITTLCIDSEDKVHPSKKAQIAHLKVDKASIKVPSEYTNFGDVFSPKLAVRLLKHTEINNHAIKLVDDQ